MREYLQIILILPIGIFYLIKWTSFIWGPIFLIIPLVYEKWRGVRFSQRTKFFKLFLLSLYFLIRFAMSKSNLVINNPEVYNIDLLEICSYLFTVLYSCFFFLDQKKNYFKNVSDDKFSLYLGFIVIIEAVISILDLYLSGYLFS